MRMPSLKTSGLILLVIIISIVLLQMVLHLFPQKITGSFEYIRKGEDLIDKGKSADSIKYFEKAYESSPENETIKSELVYAYSACSKALADKNKYDEAIDYLAKAYNVAPSASTTQNLAMMYSTKALHEAQKGDLMKAKIIYDKMRSLTDGLDSVSKNIAILLYNDGISEYKSGREDTAILCLKESSSTYKDSRISELLGDLYYKHAEFNMARFYWHEAKTLDPGNAALAEKLNKVNKEMSLATEATRRTA